VNQEVGFGGRCHWCAEAVFQAIQGVQQVEQGFIRSSPPDDAGSEALIVKFEPEVIGLASLIDILGSGANRLESEGPQSPQNLPLITSSLRSCVARDHRPNLSETDFRFQRRAVARCLRPERQLMAGYRR
jgi:hypothetical protein